MYLFYWSVKQITLICRHHKASIHRKQLQLEKHLYEESFFLSYLAELEQQLMMLV